MISGYPESNYSTPADLHHKNVMDFFYIFLLSLFCLYMMNGKRVTHQSVVQTLPSDSCYTRLMQRQLRPVHTHTPQFQIIM